MLFNTIANTFGVALISVDDAAINFQGVKILNKFDSKDEIRRKLYETYYQEAMKGALKIVGSLEILGNPVGLFSKLSTGVVDVFE